MQFYVPNTDTVANDGNLRGTGPEMFSLLVAGDVVDPIGYQGGFAAGGDHSLVFQTPICPDGYTSMGDVLSIGKRLSNKGLKCVPTDCVEDNGKSQNQYTHWGQRGLLKVLNDWTRDKNASGDNGYNLFRINGGNGWKRIKPQCLSPPSAPSTKDPEDENIALGIGWYGHPYKTDPRYSIFAFLGLVPEGMIVHQATGRRFYIIHYGGEDVNKYIALNYDPEQDKFNSALQVNDNPNNPRVNNRNISRKDERQQWQIILQGNKKYLTLKNIMNGRHLYIGLEPKTGNTEFSTIPLNNGAYHSEYPFNQLNDDQINQSTTFSFISTFGTQMDIIDKESSK